VLCLPMFLFGAWVILRTRPSVILKKAEKKHHEK